MPNTHRAGVLLSTDEWKLIASGSYEFCCKAMLLHTNQHHGTLYAVMKHTDEGPPKGWK